MAELEPESPVWAGLPLREVSIFMCCGLSAHVQEWSGPAKGGLTALEGARLGCQVPLQYLT